ncbi:hypothetical protein [Cyanobium sp. NS01]|uniref:hypothetical protein n=1 Tax=Cyanobium sp. NS01 TaxID=261284 RepID=UPI00185FA980|nr:hypothetical protein [Cyanobium sp. NS01]QNI69818.1 hypothetical protein CyaNS01_00670 [Cyanobium sp. NS01]
MQSSAASIPPTAQVADLERHRQSAQLIEALSPGSFVTLRNQPPDLPPFQLIQCRGGRCWVRQQSWGAMVQWEVAHRQLRGLA